MDPMETKKIRGGETSINVKQTPDGKTIRTVKKKQGNKILSTVVTTQEKRDGKTVTRIEETQDSGILRKIEKTQDGTTVVTIERAEDPKKSKNKKGAEDRKILRRIEKTADGKKSVTIVTEEVKERMVSLDRINVLMARNGSGKTRLLKHFYNHLTPGRRFYKKPETGAYGGYVSSQDPDRMSGKDKKRAEEGREDSLQGKGVKNINADADFKLQSFIRLNSLVKNEYVRMTKEEFDLLVQISKSPEMKDPTGATDVGKLEAHLREEILKVFNVFPSGDFCYEETSNTEELGLKFKPKGLDFYIPLEQISSGESACIAMMAAIYSFCRSLENREAESWLLLDEPDTHLHPDLLHALVNRFLLPLLDEYPGLHMLIATHSTPLLGALNADPRARVAFMNPDYTARTDAQTPSQAESTGASQAADQTEQIVAREVVFHGISDQYQKLLPVFGAHPLTSVYAEKPVCIVEGEDDYRVWDKALRTAQGSLKLHPCVASLKAGEGGQSHLKKYEEKAAEIIRGVYDDYAGESRRALAYSIYDLDEKISGSRDDFLRDAQTFFEETRVKRLILNCRAIENLLLSDEVLGYLGYTWEGAKVAIYEWIKSNPRHQNIKVMKNFAEGGIGSKNKHFELEKQTTEPKGAPRGFKTWEGPYDRRRFDLKEIRNDIMSALGCSKSWEDCIGQVIGALVFIVAKHEEYQTCQDNKKRGKIKKSIKSAVDDKPCDRIWLCIPSDPSHSILTYLGPEIVREFNINYLSEPLKNLIVEFNRESPGVTQRATFPADLQPAVARGPGFWSEQAVFFDELPQTLRSPSWRP